MDMYERKFTEMQKYIPFLEAMIERLKRVKDNSRESQLQKMQSLHGILSNSNGKKLTIEKLQRCEEVLLKLHSKVDKGNASGTLQAVKKEAEDVKPIITGNLKPKLEVASSVDPERGKDIAMNPKRLDSSKVPKEEETPASPSPPASPDQVSQPRVTTRPIIIPTERSDGFTGTSSDDRPASPDPCEMIATIGMRQPIIIPTERADSRPLPNPLKKIDPEPLKKHIPTVNNYSDNNHGMQQNANLWQNSRRSNAGERGPSALRHIPTIPTPSKGATLLRKPVLILDKKASDTESPVSKWDSPQPSGSEPRLTSPDRDSHSQRSSITSPKSKELPPLSKLPPTPLLVSPPPVLKEPPLTIEDIAELLQDESDNKSPKKPEASKDNDPKSERFIDEGKNTDKASSSNPSMGVNRDGKAIKTINLTQDDLDQESERRWEEEYRHIVKMPSRRIFTSPSSTPTKHSDARGSAMSQGIANQSAHSSSMIGTERPTDPRNRPITPPTKERDPPVVEPRYADNYEKHPRGQSRDSHKHNSIPDLNPINSAFSRNSHNDPNNCDDRSSAHYQQRPYSGNVLHVEQPMDPRRDNSDFFRGMLRDRERENQQNVNRAPMLHSPGRSGDSCNQSQWVQNPNYQSPAQSNMQCSNMQYQQRPDMWPNNSVGNNMDPHMMGGDPSYNRPSHYPPAQNSCGRPMMSPQDMNHGPCMDQGFRDDQPMIPPLIPPLIPSLITHPSAMMQPQGYPPGPQYRNFPPENRPNVQQFDRPQDFPHPRQSWEQQQQQQQQQQQPPMNRPVDSYPRPVGPGQWNRPNRGGPLAAGASPAPPPPLMGVQGNRERNFNDRGRVGDSSRPATFNRDPRTRAEPPVLPPSGNSRPRAEAPPQVTTPPVAPANARREHNRFSKESPQATGSKPKESAPSTDRNARRRPDLKDSSSKHMSSKDVRKSNEKKRSSYSNEKKGRRESDNDNKNHGEKLSKDVMQSPLESLYGVIDTTAKTGKGYGLQKFKIPKIRRAERVPSPPKTLDDNVEENWDLPNESSSTFEDTAPIGGANEASIVEVSQTSRNESDDKKAEVTSTTCDTTDESLATKETVQTSESSAPKETPVQSSEVVPAIDTSSKNTEETNASTKKSDTTKNTDEVTENDLKEKVARILESIIMDDEDVALKICQALQGKINHKSIQNLVNRAEGTSSEKAEERGSQSKKVASKKKRRVVVPLSDSSDEECLAERLSLKDTPTSDKSESPESRVEATANEDNIENTTKSNANDKSLTENTSSNNAVELSDDTSRDTRDAPSKKGKPFRRKKRERKTRSEEATKEQPAEVVEPAPEANEAPEEKSTSPKDPTTKTKIKRRNSLEMLQEDVREMFISDGVVSATGPRMCRLVREAQSLNVDNLSVSVESLSSQVTKNKKGSTTSLDRHGAKVESDGDEAVLAPPPVSSRGKGGRGRSRRRTRGRGAVRQSIKEIASSDSEEEDSARTLARAQNEASETTKASDESAKSEATGESLKNIKDDSEETYFLRRSERVGLRESMKDPKVLAQRSELGKIDSSKIMFDTSSDESFGIDVSELTAAVDISLHPEPQALTSSSPVAKPSISKSAVTRRRKTGRTKGNTAEDKIDNVASADEVDSIASDLSRASSLTRGKKTSVILTKPDTNEELLSDLLIGLVDSKTPGADNDIDCDTPAVADGKTTRRKKKKKGSWAMGIVKNKKRKKKVPSPVRPAAEVTEAENLEPSFEASRETKIDPNDLTSPNKSSACPGIEPKEEILSDSSVPKSTGENADNATIDTLTVRKEEPSTPVKSQSSVEKEDLNLNDTTEDKKPLDELLTDGSKSDIEFESNTDFSKNYGVRKLMSYVWSARKERFKCLFCPWIGKNIVHHYTLGHPGREIMISRLTIPESRRAIGQAMVDDYEKRQAKPVVKETRKFTCRFCVFTSEGSSTTALEAFYEHCTTHTGEYRFRCNSCPYQTVARSSMRTHYYRRVCPNKYHGNMNLAISEDPVPDEDFLHGYICTKCNFVQLKESNVSRHIKLTHDQIPNVDIVKINMSSFVEKDLYTNADSLNKETLSDETEELKIEEDPLGEPILDASATTEFNESATTEINISGRLAEGSDNIDIVDGTLKNEQESEPPCPGKSTDVQSAAVPTAAQEGANDGPTVAGNLSAFVCPPELENKEDEIQHERRKKMQEVVDNIGILNKANEKRDLSIIDKLKDKMTTDLDESLEAARSLEATQEGEASKAAEIPAVDVSATNLPVLMIESVTSLAEPDSNSKGPQGEPCVAETSEEISEAIVKDELPEPAVAAVPASETPEAPKEEDEAAGGDETEKKIKDPLAILDEQRKDESSDGEETDNDNVTERARSYESDSTTDQSDSEIPADVDSLLGEINSTTNAPMMTTIQRLAAKLQGEKSLPVGEGTSDMAEVSEQEFAEVIPKAPKTIPISCVQRFLGRRNAMLQEVAKEMSQVVDTEATDTPPASPPKKFIRLRRLSGDKLSVPGPAEPPSVESPPIEATLSPKVDDSVPNETAEVVKADTEEECSFLRIENVVSLAGVENNPSETTIHDILKAVGNTNITNVTTLSVFKGDVIKKSNSPNILKRGPGNLSGAIVGRSSSIQNLPVLPIQSSLAVKNGKFVRLVTGRTSLKQKDSTHRIFGSKMKSPDMFMAMLEPAKLRQFYKCMARNCSYTTDCQQAFGTHYRHHKDAVDRSKMVLSTYDFQRCAYCTETLTTWNAMSEHLKDKHIYCQYQCSYCFYRALAQSYVELHQMTVHQDVKPSVLLGKRESPPIEVIDRREFVIPFVCHHECGKSFYVPGAFLAHLRTKHGNSLSIFKCHMCPAPLFNAEKLVAHYKLHGIYKYQCLYCIFGSEQSSDVHAHLSASHYNRPPHILERTLQPRPVRDKDVIQQLVVLNVDEGFKCTELVLAPDQDAADIPKNKHWFQVDRNTSDGSAVGQIKLPIGNIGMNRLFPYEKLDATETGKSAATLCNPATPIITKFRNCAKISPKKSPENMLVVDDTGGIIKIAKRREIVFPSATKNSSSDDLATTTEFTDTPSDPLETSRRSHSTEEFINFNILDNPEFLGSTSAQSSSASVIVKAKSFDDTANTNDDSDIEILEHIDISTKKSTGSSIKVILPESVKQSITPVKETSRKDTSEKQTPVPETTEGEPVIVCSSTENSLDLNINPNTTEEIDKNFTRPLTLDDIKNTGFTGRHLYRCGYDGCEFGAETSALLRTHIKECIFATETKNLNCIHCSKRFVKIGFLLEHFKLHGLKRFGCSLCSERWSMPYQAMSHMKSKHRNPYTKLIPADPKNPSADGLFVVEVITASRDRSRGKKRGRVKSLEKEVDKLNEAEKLSFGPTEIDSLPRQPIYQREVQCAVCPYTTKVRTNIIRHLQLHAKDETVPESGPVNPVPCLDKKEKMFDKMVNLASSSHQNGRMGGTKTKGSTAESDAEFLPKFIPEHKRYVCGVTECNYLSIDEVMLRTHLKALHPDEPYFRCPHCPAQVPGHEAQNIAIDKMGIHLKMHDTRLYKCSHCNHHHYHRHVVERHLTDKHSESSPYVKVIREPESTETVPPQAPQDDADEGAADPEGNHWKCNVCDYKCVYKSEMASHASSSHEEKSQFKCSLCHYKSNNKINFDQHINAKHASDPNADYTMVYQKIKGVGGTRRQAEGGEAGGLDEPFDTTPLWRRDMPRVRHIRGILFEDEDISQPESSPVKSGKRKSDADISTRPVKSKPGKGTATDVSNADKDNDSMGNGCTETSSSDRRFDLAEDFVDAESLVSSVQKFDTTRLAHIFGPYGSPILHFYQCTICQSFKTKYKHDMRDHLYRDLKYWRYRCSICGYMGVSKNSALKHFMRTHENRRPTAEEQSCLPVNFEIETWVQTLLKSQTAQMRGIAVDAHGNPALNPRKTTVANSRRPMVDAAQKTSTTNITQSPLKDTSLKAKTVDLTQAITDMNDKSMTVDTDCEIQNVEDEDSNDNDALVIDSKDDGLEDPEAIEDASLIDEGETSADQQRLLECKHCTMKFARLRGLKLHVQIRHLRRLAFLCPYCDTSSNSEKIMKKHIALKHVGLPEEIIPNTAKNLPELTNEFWEKEYRTVIAEKTKKRKRISEDLAPDPFEKTSGLAHVCNTCGFRAINIFGLGVHMRIHTAVKSFKCAYCSYAAAEKVHLWQHSEINHWNLDWKAGNGDGSVPGTSESNENDQVNQERLVKDSTSVAENRGPLPSGEVKLDLMYSCFYCNTIRKTKEGVQDHWKLAHKTKVSGDPAGQRTAMPFRYKEVAVTPLKTMLRCGYCPKRGSVPTIKLHSRKKHPSKPVKFVEIPVPAAQSAPSAPSTTSAASVTSVASVTSAASATSTTSAPSAPAAPSAPPAQVNLDGWVCQWCKEYCDSEAKKKVHQNMFHSHLPASFKRQEKDTANVSAVPEVEASNCPECPFKTSSIAVMQKHVAKHLDSSRCTRCDKTFPDVTVAINHNRQAHRGEISAIESFVPNVEKIMARVVWRGGENSNKTLSETWRNYGVAKKSTTKSLLRINPTPTDFKAVARKSTNPLPRYPPGIRFNTEDIDTSPVRTEPAVSYYGKPRVPVNLTNISTYITLGGGRQMKLTCTALAQLFDIEPRVMIEDIKQKNQGIPIAR